MKGRYSGRRMTIYGTIVPRLYSIGKWIEKTQRLTQKAKYRLKVVDWYRFHRKNISLTARHFGLTRYTVRSWVCFNQAEGIEYLSF